MGRTHCKDAGQQFWRSHLIRPVEGKEERNELGGWTKWIKTLEMCDAQ